MPQITKRIYPTISVQRLVAKYNIDTDKEIMEASSYEFVQGTFDLSEVTNAESCKFVANVIEANKSVFGGFSASSFTVQMRYDISVLGVSVRNLTLTTGAKGFVLEAEEIAKVNSTNTCKFTLRPSYLSYSGSAPSYMQTFGNVYIAIDEEANQTSYLEYTVTEPLVEDFIVNGISIDLPITCTWVQEDVATWAVQAILNGNVIATKTGTTETTCTFLPSDLTEAGEYTFKIIASNGSQTVVATATATLTGTQVAITSLEPNGVNQLKSSNINISFSGANITNYSISAKQKGITKWNTSGTNTSGATSFVFQMVKNLFDIGNVELELTCTYNGNYYSNSAYQTAAFLVYGAPTKPIIVVEQAYTTPTPTINFSCVDAYISYQVEVDGVQVTETFGTPNKYKIPNALSNNAYHTFKIRVKNQYQLWSEWASITFLISYAELETPVINAYADNGNNRIIVNVESVLQANFHNHSIFRSVDGQTWIEIAKQLTLSDSFADLTCASNVLYYYRVRANDVNGGIKDSEIMSCMCEFERSVLSVPFSQKSITLEYFGDEKSINKQIVNNSERTFTSVCGLRQPKSKRSNVKYNSFSLNLAFKTKDDYEAFMEFEDEEALLFRDKNGLKLYCDMAIISEQDMRYYFKIVSIVLTEVYYKEGDYEEVPDTTFSYVKDEW